MEIEKIIRDYFPGVIHMSLGTSSNNKPWVCEVHFTYDDNLNLYFASLPSRRHSQEIAANPSVSGTIHKQHSSDEPPMGVYFEGTAKQLKPGDEPSTVLDLFKKRVSIAEQIIAETAKPDGPKFYKITVEKYYVFGNLDKTVPKKYELDWK